MPMYTFYCCRSDGAATTFDALELRSKSQAKQRASSLIREHQSCSHVVVFEDDVEVVTVHRETTLPPVEPPCVSVGRISAIGLAEALKGGAADRLNIALIATTVEGTIVFWNKPATRLYGWRQDEAIGRNVVDLKAAAQSRTKAEEIMSKLQAGEHWSGEIVLRHRDGSLFRVFAADIPLGAVARGEGIIVGASTAAARRQAVLDFQPILHAALVDRFGEGLALAGA